MPWNVPTHIPPMGRWRIVSMRPRISRDALLVKVTARMPDGRACPVATSQATRWASTRVFPLPAPASTSAWPVSAVTAARCSSFSGSMM